MKRIALLAAAAMLSLAACSTPQPRVIQATADLDEVRLTPGMATQIEMPVGERVQSAVVGNGALVSADKTADIVTLTALGGAGETNLIVRAFDKDGKARVHQYRLVVLAR